MTSPQFLPTSLITHVHVPDEGWTAVAPGTFKLTDEAVFLDALTNTARSVPGLWVQFAGADGVLYGFLSGPGYPWVKWALPVPAVTGIDPAAGPAATVVAVTGSGFSAASAVAFGTTAAESFTVTSDTSLTAAVPAGLTPGAAVDVTVTGPGGTSPAAPADLFTPQ